jgi:hypothetical protein
LINTGLNSNAVTVSTLVGNLLISGVVISIVDVVMIVFSNVGVDA